MFNQIVVTMLQTVLSMCKNRKEHNMELQNIHNIHF